MELKKRIESTETILYAATIKLGKEKEKLNPDALTIDKWEREIQRLSAELAALKQKEGERMRFICEKCGHLWQIPSKKCPQCGYENKGLIGNLLARFGL